MRHLSDMEVARLTDEAPTDEEAAHLSDCGDCRREVAAARAQMEALASLGEMRAPANGWVLLERRLRAEGIVGSAGGAAGGWRRALPRMAAAVAIFVAGGMTGEILRGPASTSPTAPEAGMATTAEAAERALLASEAEYVAALSRYAELTGENATGDPINRLAALEGIVLTTRAALKEAPADPVINGYHLTALTQREAILRWMSSESGSSATGWY